MPTVAAVAEAVAEGEIEVVVVVEGDMEMVEEEVVVEEVMVVIEVVAMVAVVVIVIEVAATVVVVVAEVVMRVAGEAEVVEVMEEVEDADMAVVAEGEAIDKNMTAVIDCNCHKLGPIIMIYNNKIEFVTYHYVYCILYTVIPRYLEQQGSCSRSCRSHQGCALSSTRITAPAVTATD